MYSDAAPATVDPYSDEYNAPPASNAAEREAPAARGRSRSRSPARPSANGGASNGDSRRYSERSPNYRSKRSPPPPRRANHGAAPTASQVLGVFGLSIRTQERDLEDEFNRFGRVEKVTIVYDQRSDRSRGFGFIRMASTEDATKCIQELNGVELNGRRIRVDYSMTERPHQPTPGEYMGHRRSSRRDFDRRRDDREDRGDRYRDRDSRRDRSRDRDYNRDKDRDWRDRRSPPAKRGYSPDHRRRKSHSRSPPPRDRSPHRSTNGKDFDAPSGSQENSGRW